MALKPAWLLLGIYAATALVACRKADGPLFQNPFGPPRSVEDVGGLNCQFTSRSAVNLPPEKDAPRAGDSIPVSFVNLNAKKGTAVAIVDSGKQAVAFTRDRKLLTFIQRIAADNLISTSVVWSADASRLTAVRARHMLISPGLDVVSRYTGFCEPTR